MNFVSAFLKHAEEIFATARTAGAEDCDLSILVNREGGIHVIEAAGWQLESLRAHHGASEAYRVHRTHGSVRLEARSATQSCHLAADRPERRLLPSLQDFPRYLMLQ
jgi:hypothetical protein